MLGWNFYIKCMRAESAAADNPTLSPLSGAGIFGDKKKNKMQQG